MQAISIFAEYLTTITEDIVLDVHRSEKLSRMAAIWASDPPPKTPAPSSPTSEQKAEEGNSPNIAMARSMGSALRKPFKEEICPRCQLPRHTVESYAGPQIPGKKWCLRPPIHDAPGCDIYDKPI